MRVRLALNPNNKEHVRAERILRCKAKNKRTEFIVQCILKYSDKLDVAETVHNAVVRALEGLEIPDTLSPAKDNIEKTKSADELPEDFLNSDW